jgi:hypothetical protein
VSSVLAWLDSDDDQRRRMLAVVELFKDEGTVDELGIGAIRDTISDVPVGEGTVREDLSPFNQKAVSEWITALKNGKYIAPPETLIDLFLNQRPRLLASKGK